MAFYSPPTQDLAIFDSSVFLGSGGSGGSGGGGSGSFLDYPNAQGLENLQAITVAGASVFNNIATFNTDIYLGPITVGLVNDGTNNIIVSTPAGKTTQILQLTTTTQATSDNSTKAASTAFVQNLLTTLPTGTFPIKYFTVAGNSGGLGAGVRWGCPTLNFSGASWGPNDFIKLRINFSALQTPTSGTTTPPNTLFLNCITDVYPYRCPSSSGFGSAGNASAVNAAANYPQLNNNIYVSGTYYSTFSIPSTDATFAPYQRYFSSQSYTQSGALGLSSPNCQPIYPYTSGSAQSSFGLQIWSVFSAGYSTEMSLTVEILNNTSGLPVTISGITGFPQFYSNF